MGLLGGGAGWLSPINGCSFVFQRFIFAWRTSAGLTQKKNRFCRFEPDGFASIGLLGRGTIGILWGRGVRLLGRKLGLGGGGGGGSSSVPKSKPPLFGRHSGGLSGGGNGWSNTDSLLIWDNEHRGFDGNSSQFTSDCTCACTVNK